MFQTSVAFSVQPSADAMQIDAFCDLRFLTGALTQCPSIDEAIDSKPRQI